MMRPSASTKTCSARLITACMTCSIITMAMPRSRIAWITGTMSRISDGLSPASTSSSSRSFGSIASARASSSRLRPATVRLAARPVEHVAEPDRVRDLRRRRRARRRARGRDQMCADRDVLGDGQAGERLHDLERARDAAPGEAVRRLAGDVAAGIEDAAGARRQEAGDDGEQRRLAGAVRPDQRGDAARLGGERRLVDGEQAAEAFRHRSRRAEAAQPWRAPLATVAAADAVAQVGEQAGDAARRERHDQDQHAAVDDEIEPGRVAGHELGDLAERPDHQRAEQRAEHGADAADDRARAAPRPRSTARRRCRHRGTGNTARRSSRPPP